MRLDLSFVLSLDFGRIGVDSIRCKRRWDGGGNSSAGDSASSTMIRRFLGWYPTGRIGCDGSGASYVAELFGDAINLLGRAVGGNIRWLDLSCSGYNGLLGIFQVGEEMGLEKVEGGCIAGFVLPVVFDFLEDSKGGERIWAADDGLQLG